MKKIIIALILLGVMNTCSVKKYLVYEPTNDSNIFTYYSNGIPISNVITDEAFILFAVDETKLFSRAYLRVWMLYENTDSVAFILEPYNFLTLYAEKDRKKFGDFYAESPSKILGAIDEEKAVAMIFQAIGGTLEAITAEDTRIRSSTGEAYRIGDREGKRDRVLRRNREDLQNTAYWYDSFKQSINTGVLRKNTVFPGKSVNGYLYYPLKDIDGTGAWNEYQTDIEDLRFFIKINSEKETKVIELKETFIW